MQADLQTVSLTWYSALEMLRNAYRNTFAEGHPETQAIGELLELVETKRYSVAVMGEFKRGKSSLINALLGSALLPADISPTTATVSRIVYGEHPALTMYMRDGRTEPVPVDEAVASIQQVLMERITKCTQSVLAASSQVREAVIAYPTPLCQNNISIVDTPGLNDEAAMDAISRDALTRADAVVMVLSAKILYSETEAAFVADLLAEGRVSNIVFVCTFLDAFEPADQARIMEHIRGSIPKKTQELLARRKDVAPETLARAKEALGGFPLYGASARQAMDAVTRGDPELLKASGVPQFRQKLLERTTAQQSSHIVARAGEYLCTQRERYALHCGREEARLRGLLQAKAPLAERARAAADALGPWLQQALLACDKALEPAFANPEPALDACRAALIRGLGQLHDDRPATLAMLMARVVQQYERELRAAYSEPLRAQVKTCFSELCDRLGEKLDNISHFLSDLDDTSHVSGRAGGLRLQMEAIVQRAKVPAHAPPTEERLAAQDVRETLRDSPVLYLQILAPMMRAAYADGWKTTLADLRLMLMNRVNQAQVELQARAQRTVPPIQAALERLADAQTLFGGMLAESQARCAALLDSYRVGQAAGAPAGDEPR